MEKFELIEKIKSLTNEYDNTSVLWSYTKGKLERLLENLIYKEQGVNKSGYKCELSDIISALDNGIITYGLFLEPENLCLQKIYDDRKPIFVYRKDGQYLEIDPNDINKTWCLKK